MHVAVIGGGAAGMAAAYKVASGYTRGDSAKVQTETGMYHNTGKSSCKWPVW